ncbi:hypothetical protein NLU13_0551 [Sarocladium strictum]|uniref:UBC core domain-containing protein n=1 Tax=Sarocladium strictum TaxID=5046 RepID=A0AA39GQ13_SARSR|nr:hypothetical protein NLU13_0551 [Sarocladium strictum]
MATLALGNLPSLRRQHLLSEFAGLKQACPEGVFISLTPDNPALWAGVLFVRDGPYASAILRFQIAFPDSYPRLPPLFTFTTDMFHPLITPLTTYMYTTDIQDNGTVSATDAERLPPGGFSLRHGFPEWFGRGRRSIAAAKRATEQASATPGPQPHSAPTSDSKSAGSTSASQASYMQTKQKNVSLYDVLKYVRSTFDSEEILDSLPLDAAGNPNAWHAWRTHRRKLGKLPAGPADSDGTEEVPLSNEDISTGGDAKPVAVPQQQVRDPSEWNWDGVWELRVKKAIAASLSEPVLYGGATTGAGDDVIRFSPMDEEDVESIKSNLRRTLEGSA